ncbi:ATP-binding protein [Caulobacter segnis]|uniref:ATP-binding protein n=2 Tax=Caulobacter segnis TaxID=88688 RepID=D5VED9_CAUST|nr:ATP-binding protein [Caulobacter segnis]ADG08962.1 conserved hypothetical protein [Caulobacter segnis ATCC 21756]AVQ00799.1 ATP-binding protein [Caulobacter segnis]
MEATRVKADPTKAFFVRTITRDIRLEDCILDLVDNSLDGARSMLGAPASTIDGKIDFSKFLVEIHFSEDGFSIVDNCGGISLDDAINYAFTFGRREDDDPEDYTIGVYGIGMKRAVFKLGNQVSVRSTNRPPKKGAAPEPFEVTIDVPEWLKSPTWDFDLGPSDPLSKPGVEIVVKDLNDEVAAVFATPGFENNMRRLLGRDYSRFISHGLTIKVNGKAIRPFEFGILQSDTIKPFRADFTFRDVRVELISGMAAQPSESDDPDEDAEKEDRSGWYVLCNDRLVLAADKSIITGWGYEGKNRWHPQYRGFIGIVHFSAKSTEDLPLTTTKRSIDPDRQVYKGAIGRMIELTRAWIDYTNKRKSALEEAKSLEGGAKYVPAFDLPINKTLSYPTLTSAPRVKEITIQYPKLQRLVRDLAQGFGDPGLSAREVGNRSFDYAYRELVGEVE